MNRILTAILLCSSAVAQEGERRFELKHVTGTPLLELATALRVVGGVDQIQADKAANAITVKGSADRMILAEWLVSKMDISQPSGIGQHEFPLKANDQVALVYELAHTASQTGLQEIVTTLRTLGNTIYLHAVRAEIDCGSGHAGVISLSRSF